MNDHTMVSLSLNGVEWINIGKFYYFEPEIDWIGLPAHFNEVPVKLILILGICKI